MEKLIILNGLNISFVLLFLQSLFFMDTSEAPVPGEFGSVS